MRAFSTELAAAGGFRRRRAAVVWRFSLCCARQPVQFFGCKLAPCGTEWLTGQDARAVGGNQVASEQSIRRVTIEPAARQQAFLEGIDGLVKLRHGCSPMQGILGR